MKVVATVLGCAAALCALTATASASSLAVDTAGVLRLSAAPGEANGVSMFEVGLDGGWAFAVEDTAGLRAGRGCTQASPTRAQCVIGGASDPALGGLDIRRVILDLRDRADTSSVMTLNGFASVEVQGDGGSDRLSGGAVVPSGTSYTADGGAGDDTIDRVSTNGSAVDVDGGPGADVISTLGTVGAGLLRGGPGADSFTLRGNVFGTVDGGPGPDTFSGDAWIISTVFGGAGNDAIDLLGAASVNCGVGRDSNVAYEQQVASACET